MEHDQPGSSEQAPDLSGLAEPEIQGCIRCCTRRLKCDLNQPKCGRCAGSKKSPTCSYEWTLESIIALFPRQHDMSTEISLRLLEEITDNGAFGKVYRTSRKADGRLVAVKVLFRRKQTPQRILLLALREALTWSQLSHDNLVPLIGVADYSVICEGAPARLCLVSPWMTGGKVMDYLNENPMADRKSLMLDLVDAVCYLHTGCPNVIVHGDIRGSNILVDITGGKPKARLTDFGLSFALEDNTRSGGFHSNPTSTGRAGHPRWLAPERLFPENFGLSPYTSKSKASDVFEMCRTFLEILSGQWPFFGFHDFKVVRMVEDGKHPERPSNAGRALTDVIWLALQSGWAQDRQERLSASDMRAIVVAEIIIDAQGSELGLSALARLPLSDVMDMLKGERLHLWMNEGSLAAILDALKSLPARILKPYVALLIPMVTRILRWHDSSIIAYSGVESAFSLLLEVDDLVQAVSSEDRRDQLTHMYVSSARGCVVDAELHLLIGGRLKSDLQARVRSHLLSLLSREEIGVKFRDWIVETGRLSDVLTEFEMYCAPATPQKTYLGLALLNGVVSTVRLPEYADVFLEAGVLPTLSRSFETSWPLYWDIILTWEGLLKSLLRLIKYGDYRRDALLHEQRNGWYRLSGQTSGVILDGMQYKTVLDAALVFGDDAIISRLLVFGDDRTANRLLENERVAQELRRGHSPIVWLQLAPSLSEDKPFEQLCLHYGLVSDGEDELVRSGA